MLILLFFTVALGGPEWLLSRIISIKPASPAPRILIDGLQRWELGPSWEAYRSSLACYVDHYQDLDVGKWVIVSRGTECEYAYSAQKPSPLPNTSGILFRVGFEFFQQPPQVTHAVSSAGAKSYFIAVNYTYDGVPNKHDFVVDVGAVRGVLSYDESRGPVKSGVKECWNHSGNLYFQDEIVITQIGDYQFQTPLISEVCVPSYQTNLSNVMGLDVILQSKLVHFKLGGTVDFYWDSSRVVFSQCQPWLESTALPVFRSSRGVVSTGGSSRFEVMLHGVTTLIDTGSEASVQPWSPLMQPANISWLFITVNGTSIKPVFEAEIKILGKKYFTRLTTEPYVGYSSVLGSDVLSQMDLLLRTNQSRAQMFLMKRCSPRRIPRIVWVPNI